MPGLWGGGPHPTKDGLLGAVPTMRELQHPLIGAGLMGFAAFATSGCLLWIHVLVGSLRRSSFWQLSLFGSGADPV